jgi:hypothetical protein
MKPSPYLPSGNPFGVFRRLPALLLLVLLAHPASAHASMFHGETLDKISNVLAWIVLIIAPTVAIAVFWLVHILPEKVAEKKEHPQAAAIQCLCLLSLFFGGLLWPLAWLWAYSKPVMYKLAYGTDRVPHGHDDKPATPAAAPAAADAAEVARLRQQITELETKLAGKAAGEKGKA